MFGISSFGFVLLLIKDWQLAMQVNIRQSFFHQCLEVALFAKLFDSQSFLLYSITKYQYNTIRYKILEGENFGEFGE